VRETGFVYVRFHFRNSTTASKPPAVETFLGAFAKLRKRSLDSLCMSVCPSACNSSAPTDGIS